MHSVSILIRVSVLSISFCSWIYYQLPAQHKPHISIKPNVYELNSTSTKHYNFLEQYDRHSTGLLLPIIWGSYNDPDNSIKISFLSSIEDSAPHSDSNKAFMTEIIHDLDELFNDDSNSNTNKSASPLINGARIIIRLPFEKWGTQIKMPILYESLLEYNLNKCLNERYIYLLEGQLFCSISNRCHYLILTITQKEYDFSIELDCLNTIGNLALHTLSEEDQAKVINSGMNKYERIHNDPLQVTAFTHISQYNIRDIHNALLSLRKACSEQKQLYEYMILYNTIMNNSDHSDMRMITPN